MNLIFKISDLVLLKKLKINQCMYLEIYKYTFIVHIFNQKRHHHLIN